MFVGRRTELDLLTKQLDHVKRTGGGTASTPPSQGASSVEAVGHFLGALRDSSMLTSGGRNLLPSQPTAGGWGDMLQVLAGVLPDTPSVVVFDELPWIPEQDATFDGHLQGTRVGRGTRGHRHRAVHGGARSAGGVAAASEPARRVPAV